MAQTKTRTKTKPAVRATKSVARKPKPAPRAKKTTAHKPAIKPAPLPEKLTAEYREYLERYEMDGAGRPRLTPAEFDQLDEELLDLLALEAERGLSDEQTVRLQELEYLLLDSE